jgi:hypothetical protein
MKTIDSWDRRHFESRLCIANERAKATFYFKQDILCINDIYKEEIPFSSSIFSSKQLKSVWFISHAHINDSNWLQ